MKVHSRDNDGLCVESDDKTCGIISAASLPFPKVATRARGPDMSWHGHDDEARLEVNPAELRDKPRLGLQPQRALLHPGAPGSFRSTRVVEDGRAKTTS